ncbi:Uncharacterised protein [Edwardsiella hoshinae]|uniref:Uncharacterized protein n=1 Tax=Edwardsiella hoshinae TaxID=93378 RepID=A0A376DH84_9GAMM|nr:Uncharacterised protein [Edwardsiella hoshinae]
MIPSRLVSEPDTQRQGGVFPSRLLFLDAAHRQGSR